MDSSQALRAYERMDVDAAASLSPLGDTREADGLSVHIANISIGGACIRADRPIEVGSTWTLELSEHGGRRACVVIRWAREGAGGWDHGLQFVLAPEALGPIGLAYSGTPDAPGPVQQERASAFVSCPRGLVVASARGLTAEVRGDLHVEESLDGCRIEVRGTCHAEDAVVVGGELVCTNAASVGTIGADGMLTRVCVGFGSPPQDAIAHMLRRVDGFEREARARRAKLDALRTLDPSTLNPVQREELTVLMCDVPELECKVESLREKVSQFQSLSAGSTATLTVRERIAPGSVLGIGGPEFQVVAPVDGPVTLHCGETPTIESETGCVRLSEHAGFCTVGDAKPRAA